MENEDRNTQSTSFDYIGESFAATSSYTVNYTRMIGQQWYGEKRYFNYYSMSCYDDDGNVNEDEGYETCGRYTQVCAILVTLLVAYELASFLHCRWCGPGRMLWAVELSDVLNSKELRMIMRILSSLCATTDQGESMYIHLSIHKIHCGKVWP